MVTRQTAVACLAAVLLAACSSKTSSPGPDIAGDNSADTLMPPSDSLELDRQDNQPQADADQYVEDVGQLEVDWTTGGEIDAMADAKSEVLPDLLEEIQKDIADDLPVDVEAEVPGDVADETVGDIAEDLPADVPEEVWPDIEQEISPDICEPFCDGMECGGDGCGGSCGECDDGDPCTVDENCVEGTCQPGQPAECDDYNICSTDSCIPLEGCQYDIDEECQAGDWDHDGIPNPSDACPYSFDPGNPDENGIPGADACEPLVAHGAFESQQPLNLLAGGDNPKERRTNEPVELLLRNGISDSSLFLHLAFEGEEVVDASPYQFAGVEVFGSEPQFTPAPAAALGDALYLDGDACLKITDQPPFPAGAFTVMAYFKSGDPAIIYDNSRWWTDAGFLIKFNTGKYQFTVGDGFKLCDLFIPMSGWDTEVWHHVAFVFSHGRYAAFAEGVLLKEGTMQCTKLVDDENPAGVGCNDNSFEPPFVPTYVDELLIFSRALTAEEVGAYYRSKTTFGTDLVPGAQKVLRAPRDRHADEPGPESVTRTRIIGPHPHSDTPCPPAADPALTPDRQDLCGVEAYWRLDGDLQDVLGQHDGGAAVASPVPGRFGDHDGALFVDGTESPLALPGSSLPGSGVFTAEMWVSRGDSAPGCQQEPHLISRSVAGAADGNFRLYFAPPACALVAEIIHEGEVGLIQSDVLLGHWAPGQWRHFAAVRDEESLTIYVDGLPAASPYKPAGGLNVADNGADLVVGGSSIAGDSWFPGGFDELILHHSAKSADYLYHRANPGAPAIRFLAATAASGDAGEPASGHEVRGYTLHWQDGDAWGFFPYVSSAEGEVCFGLLNRCLGYAGWWRFDDLWGDKWVDSSTLKTHAVDEGAQTAPDPVAGQSGTALSFSGGESLLAASEAPVNGEVTVEATVLPGGDGRVVGWGNVLLEAWGLAVDGGDPGFGQSGWDSAAIAGEPLLPSVWSQLAGVRTLNMLSLHIDGAPAASAEATPAASPPGGSYVTIGRSPGSAPLYFSGYIDSVRIMTRALDADEFLHHPSLSPTQ